MLSINWYKSMNRGDKIARINRLLQGEPTSIKTAFQWDDEAVWSITNFAIGKKICAHILALDDITRGSVLVDAMAGVGGNTIQFAKHFTTIAIELNPERKKMLDHNLSICNVFARTYCGLYQNYSFDCDVLFFDPPWGVEYKRQKNLRISVCDNSGVAPIEALISTARAKYCVVKLPHNYDFAYFRRNISGSIIAEHIYGRPNSFVILIIRVAS